jgi:hypothetical protein
LWKGESGPRKEEVADDGLGGRWVDIFGREGRAADGRISAVRGSLVGCREMMLLPRLRRERVVVVRRERGFSLGRPHPLEKERCPWLSFYPWHLAGLSGS